MSWEWWMGWSALVLLAAGWIGLLVSGMLTWLVGIIAFGSALTIGAFLLITTMLLNARDARRPDSAPKSSGGAS